MNRTFFRSPRGGNCPLDAEARANLLALYAELVVPVVEIAEIYSVGTWTIYRWLYLLGVRPQSDMTPREAQAFAAAKVTARENRRKTRAGGTSSTTSRRCSRTRSRSAWCFSSC